MIQNENDSIHSTVEKSKQEITILHPFQWVIMVQSACKTRPYIVETIDTDDFLPLETSMDGEYAVLIKNLQREIEQEKTKINQVERNKSCDD